jgi:hypothetical protein
MNRLDHGSVPRERWEGSGLIGTAHVAHLVRLCRSIGDLAPRDVLRHVPPDALHGTQLRTVGGQPHVPDMLGPAQAWGRMGAAVIQEPAM